VKLRKTPALFADVIIVCAASFARAKRKTTGNAKIAGG